MIKVIGSIVGGIIALQLILMIFSFRKVNKVINKGDNSGDRV